MEALGWAPLPVSTESAASSSACLILVAALADDQWTPVPPGPPR
jgi:hypothetical protein